jgi:hypothetical protein
METADMGLGRPDASVGESGHEVVVGEVEITVNRFSSCESWSVPEFLELVAARAELVVEVVSGLDQQRFAASRASFDEPGALPAIVPAS